MGAWLHGLWSAMWPNIFAPSFFTVLGIGLSHFRHGRELRRLHDRFDRLHHHEETP